MKPTYEELEQQVLEQAVQLANAESKCRELASESAALNSQEPKAWYLTISDEVTTDPEEAKMWRGRPLVLGDVKTPATDAFLAEARAQAHKEGAHFVANRMLVAWEAGFINDTAKDAADIARMILVSTEFMADAPEGDFDRSFADGALEDIAAQLRKGGGA
ncbi:hypothetical protein [Citrobacter braakii]|uniref:hypothetical protein n=1 Tax=Citrobacter braakii TaxID=57706 RepID=UPI0034E58E03